MRLFAAPIRLATSIIARPTVATAAERSLSRFERTYAGDNESVLRDHERSRVLRVGLRGARGAIKCWGTIAGWES